jgi:P pilus assembly chaperone PapD
MRLQKKACFLLILMLIAIFTFSLVNASTMVEPGKFIFEVKPGQKATGAIKVTNVGERAADVRAAIYDWTLDDKDSLVFLPAGTRADSLKGLIKFNPRRFKLAAGESQIVRFTLTAPTQDTLERRCIVFFEEEDSVMNRQMSASVVTQVGSTIYMSVEPMKRAFRLLKTTLEKHGEKRFGVTTVKNVGQCHIRFQVRYKITAANGAVIHQQASGVNLILPGFQRTFSFPIDKKLTPGKYNLVMDFKFMGNPKSMIRSIPFTVE